MVSDLASLVVTWTVNSEKGRACAKLCAMYTTDDLAKLFNTSTETIRQWSKEFKDFLNQPANPGPNRARQFDEKDMQVMTLIAEYKARHQRPDEITTALINGERRDPPEQSLQLRSADRGKIAQLQAQVTELQQSLSETIKASNQKDGKIEILERQLAEAQKEIRQLIGENAVLKSKSQ